MLDVIGAGATSTTEENWHELWCTSSEARQLSHELESIHCEGRDRRLAEAPLHEEFSTSWLYQTRQLIKRDAEAHWRDPTYLMAKLVLNAVGGLFIGVTFYGTDDSQQGTQNKLFVSGIFSHLYFAHRGNFTGHFHGLGLRVCQFLRCISYTSIISIKRARREPVTGSLH